MENSVDFLYDMFTYFMYAIALTLFLNMTKSLDYTFNILDTYNIDMYYGKKNYNIYENLDDVVYGHEIIGQIISSNEGNIYVDNILMTKELVNIIEAGKEYSKKELVDVNDTLLTIYRKE